MCAFVKDLGNIGQSKYGQEQVQNKICTFINNHNETGLFDYVDKQRTSHWEDPQAFMFQVMNTIVQYILEQKYVV